MSIDDNISRSARQFRDLVWPQIGPLIGGGDLIPVESVTESGFAKQLDWVGIDAWVIRAGPHMLGLASRVHKWMGYETFTIRLRTDYGTTTTEYQKRVLALVTPGAICPHWTIDSYIKDGRLVCAAAAATREVIAAVHHIGWADTNYNGGRFWAVPWDELAESGATVIRVGE